MLTVSNKIGIYISEAQTEIELKCFQTFKMNTWIFLLNFLCGKGGAGPLGEVKVKAIHEKGDLVLREQLRSPTGDKPSES